jgi:hypothetical protein
MRRSASVILEASLASDADLQSSTSESGYRMSEVILRWDESDIVAEAWSVDDHEIGACAGLFDHGDSVGRVGVAVELPTVLA